MPDEPRHILVINDTPEILDLFHELLTDEGHQVSLDTFSVGLDQKMADVKSIRPDLIILDYMWGAEDLGWQLLQLLKMDRDTAGIPVIICTAAHQKASEMQAHLEAMGVTVVLKPFNIHQLLAEVETMWARQGGLVSAPQGAAPVRHVPGRGTPSDQDAARQHDPGQAEQ